MKKSLLVLCLVLSGVTLALAQVRVTGSVTDESTSEPLAFVTVVVKGSQVNTITAEDGSFSISVPNRESILSFSSVGYETLEVTAGTGARALVVQMKPSATSLNEVVVTGIFNKAKESYTGAAVQISAEELKTAGNRSLITSIRNLDPSFNIIEDIQIGSDPNRLPSITIRGSSSLPTDLRDQQTAIESMRAANQPLIILNGFEVKLQRLMDMDENTVESITLLKDANATAMYGTRGSNGVLVITTKTPPAGRLQLTYKGSLNIEAPDLTSYNLMNAREKLAYEWAAGLYTDPGNTLYDQGLKDLYNKRMLDVERGVDTYWLKYPVRVGVGNRHSLSIEGGENTFRYSASLSYNNVAGTMKGSDRNTLNGGLLFMYRYKNLTFQNDLQITQNRGTNSPYGLFSDYGKVNSFFAPYDDEGNLLKMMENTTYTQYGINPTRVYNPLYNALLPSRNTDEYTQIINNFAIEWNITPELFVRGSMGVSMMKTRSDRYTSADHSKFDNYVGSDYARKGQYEYTTGNSSQYDGQLTLNYSKTFNDVHQFFAGVGGTISQYTDEMYMITAEGITIPDMDFLGAAQKYQKDGMPIGSENILRNVGALANVNYTYDRRYFVDVNGKFEGSSNFGTNERFAPIWSAGVGWNAHQEEFLKGNYYVNSARVRLSYGVTGSQQFESYLAYSSYQDYSGASYEGWYGASLKALGNQDLAWQKTYQYNIGTELQLINNRVRLQFDYYNKLTKDLLADINLPTAGGFKNYKANIGEVENKGFELMASVYVLRDEVPGLSWSVGGTMAHNKNTILKISNALETLNRDLADATTVNPSFLYREHESMNTIYAVRSKGIDPGSGREIYIKADDSETYNWDARDQEACGVADPKLMGSINTMVRYKGITLGAYFHYRYGGQAYNEALAGKVENIFPYNNADRRALSDRWKTPGEAALLKNISDFSKTNATSRFVMDNNSLSFSSVSLSYELPQEWIRRFGMQYLSITGYMEDIFYSSSIKREMGLNYPFSRKFSLSLTARF